MKDTNPVIIILVLFAIFGLAFGSLKNTSVKKNTTTSSNSSPIKQTNKLEFSPNKNVAEEIKKTEASVKKLQTAVEKENKKSQYSPYYNKIKMSSVYGLRNNDPEREYISLSTNLKKTETVKITGWYFKSDVTGYYAVIGGANLLPFPSTKNESSVLLQYGDKVYITKGFSPINVSFRTNKCTGYFEENRTFVPGLSLQCPLPKDEKLPVFSNNLDSNDECLKAIRRVSRCTTVDSEFIRKLPDTVTSSCKTYLTGQINYNTCVALHFSDTDFPGKEYHLYLNKFGPLWRTTHDKISLYDQNNLVVDSISY
ncbi:MAG: hypothetical protein AAB446_01595 [Patescibacteria group bacterium]